MTLKTIIASVILAAGARCALAEPQAWYFFTVTDRFLAPGESTAVQVWITFSPTVGAPWFGGGPNSQVLGLSEGGFSITCAPHAGASRASAPNGAWSGNALDAPYNFPLGTSAGVNSGPDVQGVIWAMGFLLSFPPHPSPNDPDAVWRGTFTAGATSPTGSLSLDFHSLLPTGVFGGGPIPNVFAFQSYPGRGTTIHIGKCYADCDRSGWLGVADVACFQQAFAMNDVYAECDGDGMLTLADMICFQQQFASACP